jgi:hypothetical protein
VNLRHAAALALVGWYLMVPPGERCLEPSEQPLSKWSTFESFDTAAECRAFQAITIKTTKNLDCSSARKATRKEWVKNQMRWAAMFGECIASDDPRLKGN